MANFSLYFPILLKFEGGYVNNPKDNGGPTNLGVTLKEWLSSGYDKDGDGDIDVQDLKRITPKDAEKIAKLKYWDKVRGDEINSQSVAEFLFDWAYMSGPGTAIRKLQEVLEITIDGIIGNKTIGAINSTNPVTLFNLLKARREKFFRDIVNNNPSQKVFLKGWLNRNNLFVFHG